MKKSMKKLVSCGVAAMLSVSLVVPASAASHTASGSNVQSWQQKIEQFLKNQGWNGSFNWIVTQPSTPQASPGAGTDAPAADQPQTGAVLVPLSGASEAQLVRAAGELLAAVSRPGMASADLWRIAHTLQTGREALSERLACVVSDLSALKRALEAVVAEGAAASVAGCDQRMRPVAMSSIRMQADALPTSVSRSDSGVRTGMPSDFAR